MRYWNLREMKRRSLVVFAEDPPGDSVSVSMDLLHVGVVFFPSLPFMGVMLFPSFVLRNVSREVGTLLVPLFLFSPLLPLSLLSSPSPSFSHSFFLIFLIFPISFSFPFRTLCFFPSLSLPLLLLYQFLFLFSLFLLLLFSISFSSSFLSLEGFFLGNCLYCLFPRCKE